MSGANPRPRRAAGRPRPTSEPRRTWSLAALLASLSMLAPFAIDTYLPAFPAIGQEFNAAAARRPADAVGLPVRLRVHDALARRAVRRAGSAADRARRPRRLRVRDARLRDRRQHRVAVAVSRSLQGLSAGTGLVVGRAIVRDRFHGPEAQRLMSQMTLVFGIAPADRAGPRRRAAEPVRLALDLLDAARARRRACSSGRRASLPETLPRAARQPLHPRALWRNYRRCSCASTSRCSRSILALNFAGFFIYIAGAPVFLHRPARRHRRWGFAWLFVPMISGIMIGRGAVGTLRGRRSPQQTIRLGYALMFGGRRAQPRDLLAAAAGCRLERVARSSSSASARAS